MKHHALVVATIALLAIEAHAQSTWHVDVNGTPPGTGTALDPYTSIQYAIVQPTTVTGDTLLVAPGDYVENIHTNAKGLTLRSSGGPEVTLIRPAGSGSVVKLGSNATIDGPFSALEGFTVTGFLGGGPDDGTVTSISGVLRRCIVRDNTSGVGVALNVFYDAWVYDSVITGNTVGVHCGTLNSVLQEMRGSIVWGNDTDLEFVAVLGTIDYCAGLTHLSQPIAPAHNVFGDPRLWAPLHGDVRLAPGSPCIDAGDPAAPLDPDGTRADIGVFPYDGSYAPPPRTYCTAKSNSLACVPSIGSTGSPSASGSPFVITCTNELNLRPGLLFYGYAPNGITFQGGWLCVKAPTKRTPLADSGGSSTGLDCTGAYAFDFDARIQSGIDPALVAGEMVYCQFWSRDGGDPTGFGTNRSDALRFGIGL